MKKLTVRDMADIAIVAAIYVVLTITPPLMLLATVPTSSVFLR